MPSSTNQVRCRVGSFFNLSSSAPKQTSHSVGSMHARPWWLLRGSTPS